MYGCMDVWMYGCMDVWMYGCMDVWMNVLIMTTVGDNKTVEVRWMSTLGH